MYDLFKVNKIDCASEADKAKILSWWLSYGEVLTYKQTFLNKKGKKSHLERAKKLGKIIKRVHTGKKNGAEKLIFMQNVYTIKNGLKCNETVKKSSTKNKHLQTVQASPQRYPNKYG